MEDELKIELGSGTDTDRANKLVPLLDAQELTILEEEETGEEPHVESPKKQKKFDVIWKKMKDLTQAAIDLVSKFPIDEDLSMKPLFSDIVPFIQSMNNKQKTGNSLLLAMNDVVTYDIINKIAPVTDHSPELTEEQEQELEKEEEDKAIKEKDDIEEAAKRAIILMDTAANNSEVVDSMISKPVSLEATGGSIIHKKTYKKKYKKTHKKKPHRNINKKTIKKKYKNINKKINKNTIKKNKFRVK